MQFLRQNTAASVPIGPFLDDTDAKTPETGLTIPYTAVYLSKAGGSFAAKGNPSTATHSINGQYLCPLSIVDVGTVGPMRLSVVASGALPVWEDFMVLPANAYDSMVAGTDSLAVDVTKVSGDSTAADNLESYCDGTGNIPANVAKWNGTTVSTPSTAGIPDVNMKNIAGTAVSTITAQIGVNVVSQADIDFGATQKASIEAGVPTAASITTAVWGAVVENSKSAMGVLRLILSASLGKSSGGGTSTVVFRDDADTKPRITATVDANGNRTALTTDAS